MKKPYCKPIVKSFELSTKTQILISGSDGYQPVEEEKNKGKGNDFLWED